MAPQPSAAVEAPRMPLKQKMTVGIVGLLESAKRLALGGEPSAAAPMGELFAKVDAAVDGDDCLHDCESCDVRLPKWYVTDESDVLYGHIRGWSTHILVATGKADWVRDVADEKGSVMQAVSKAEAPTTGRLMLSASNIPTPHHTSNYSEPTTVLLLPAFTIIENVTPASVPAMLSEFVSRAPTNTSPLEHTPMPRYLPPADLPEPAAKIEGLMSRPCPHRALVLLCSQKTRDARCGHSAPILRKELERHLRPLGLYRDLDDDRPGGVGIYFISHVGGHKYSANVMVYRRPDAFGLDAAERAHLGEGDTLMPERKANEGDDDVGAGQCIWLARVKPKDCENLVKYTILQGKVVKPESQLRGGFNRCNGLLSW